jgi:hypothetical protein
MADDALLREWRGDPPRHVRVNVFSKNDHKITLKDMQLVMTQNGLDATGAKIDLQRKFLAHKQALAAALATADGFLD